MVDGVYRQRVKDEVNKRRDEQHGEGPVQRRAFRSAEKYIYATRAKTRNSAISIRSIFVTSYL